MLEFFKVIFHRCNWSWIQMMLRISICTEVWNGKFIFNQSSAAVSWKKLSFYSVLVSHKSITNWHFRSLLLAGRLWCDGELLREAWCWYWQCHNFCIMVCHSFRKVEWITHTIWKEEKRRQINFSGKWTKWQCNGMIMIHGYTKPMKHWRVTFWLAIEHGRAIVEINGVKRRQPLLLNSHLKQTWTHVVMRYVCVTMYSTHGWSLKPSIVPTTPHVIPTLFQIDFAFAWLHYYSATQT